MSAPPRNAVAFLTSCSVLNDKDFAALLKLTYGQLRPKGSSPFGNLASAAALDQLYKQNATMLLR